MRFMMFICIASDEDRWEPTPEEVAAMSRYNQELQKAGIMLSAEGLREPSETTRVEFDAEGRTTVTDGPFAEAKEVVGGFWIIQARSPEEAVEWASRCPARGCTIEVRRIAEVEDFPQDVQDAYERGEA